MHGLGGMRGLPPMLQMNEKRKEGRHRRVAAGRTRSANSSPCTLFHHEVSQRIHRSFDRQRTKQPIAGGLFHLSSASSRVNHLCLQDIVFWPAFLSLLGFSSFVLHDLTTHALLIVPRPFSLSLCRPIHHPIMDFIPPRFPESWS